MNRGPFLPPWFASPPGTNLGSRLMGDLAHRRVPRPLLRSMIRVYARHYGLNLDEMASPIEACRSFAEFFTRRLRPGVRPIDRDPDAVVSPVDGTVQTLGRLEEGRFEQVKGHAYSVADFLGGDAAAADFAAGWYAVIYLSPADYHRIHCPLDGKITAWTHIPGTLVSVQPFFSNLIAGLLVSNERVLTYMDTPLGPVAVGMVGACGVGRIRLSYDDLETNISMGSRRGDKTMDKPLGIGKGDELGVFDLGSTVAVFLANPDFRPVMVPGEKIRYGQRLFETAQ